MKSLAICVKKIELPDNYDDIPQAERKQPECTPEDYLAYGCDEGSKVPAMAPFGSGYRWHVTGLIHDETGFPKGTGHGLLKLLKIVCALN